MSKTKEPAQAPTASQTEIDPETTADPALIRQFTLRVESGPDAGTVYRSKGERTIVGTHPSCDLVLRDRTISRLHCEIVVGDGQATVRDLGSSNGTLVDRVSILHAHLDSGVDLTLGRTRIVFRAEPEYVRVPILAADQFGSLVGASIASRRLFAQLGGAAGTDSSVLLEGETGTGKEVAAESIHRRSSRSSAPFVVVDCGAIPDDLFEAELFGYVRGAFTGATRDHEGLITSAHQGTLFLDEIGELPLPLQVKLLGVLERRTVRPLGAMAPRAVNVRVIAATNRDLSAEVNQKRFRSDLFYRLAVLRIRIPPLRERREDVRVLVTHFLSSLRDRHGEQIPLGLSEATVNYLEAQPWPGNIRELRNSVERAVFDPRFAPMQGSTGGMEPFATARSRLVMEFERKYLLDVLRHSHGNVTEAAKVAGIDRRSLQRMLRRQEIDPRRLK
jgi:transcriptional regulator with PAS, ATPase and Fis domain